MKENNRWILWVCRLAIVVSFCFNYVHVFDKKMDTNGDNYYYYLLAHSLAAGHGYVSEIGPTPEPHMHFPPGYPAFMSLFLRVFPDNIVAMKRINGLLLLVSLLLLFRIVRKTTGKYGVWYALLACLLCTFHGELLRWATIMMSEMLYLAISMGMIALCLELDWERLRQKDWRQILMLAGICLLSAFAYFVRTMGISIVLAVALAFFVLALKQFRKRRKEGLNWRTPLLACLLVGLSLVMAHESWTLRNRHVSPDWRSEYLDSFETPAEYTETPAAYWSFRVQLNLMAFVTYYIPQSLIIPVNAVTTPESIPVEHMHWWLGLLVIALMIIGFLSMKGLQWLCLFYVFITFGVLMVYPPSYAGMRYYVPLLPLLMAALVLGVGALMGWIVRKLKGRVAWLAPAMATLAATILIPCYYVSQVYYWQLANSPYHDDTYEQLLDACRACRDLPDDWLTAVTKPEIFYVHSHYHHAISIPRTGSIEENLRYLDDSHVDVVIVDRWFPTTSRQITPMLEDYSDRFQLIKLIGDPDHPTAVLRYEKPGK